MKGVLTLLAIFLYGFATAAEPRLIVHLLDHTNQLKTENRFWIDWSNHWQGVVATKKATPEEAANIIPIIRSSLLNEEALNYCGHQPVYGIHATDANGKSIKTSLCFSCGTWVIPRKRLQIEGKLGINNELCKALRKIIELPPELLNPKANK